jgi:hypothetical protein
VEHQYFKASQSGAAASISSVHVVKLVEDSSGNAAPSLSVSNLPSDTLRLYPGDTLSVDYLALDNAQGVIVGAQSWGLDTHYLPAGSPALQLRTLNSTGGFYGFNLSQARLRWTPDSSSLAAGPLNIPVYLWAIDSVTPGSKRSYHRLWVELRPTVQILTEGRHGVAFSSPVCPLNLQGATKSGQAQWRPASAVAQDTALQTSYTGTASGWVYLQDPVYPQREDSLYVGVIDTANFTISRQQDSLFLGAYQPPRGSLTAAEWTLNHFPLNEQGNTLKAPADGHYRAKLALRNNCTVRDSTHFSLHPRGGGGPFIHYGKHNLSAQATALKHQRLDSLYGFNFTPPKGKLVESLHLMGLSGRAGKRADSGRIRLWIYELKNTGAVLRHQQDTLISTQFSGTLTLYEQQPLEPNKIILGSQSRTHQLIWQIDSNLRINLLEGDIDASDTTGFNNYRALRGQDTAKLLAQGSRYSLATAMRTYEYFDLEEEALPKRSLHPNPAREVVYWEAPLAEDREVIISNAAGQELSRTTLKAGARKLELPALSQGLYWIKIGAQHYPLHVRRP